MNNFQEKKCQNWYMHKFGKHWVFGCSAFVVGFLLAGGLTQVSASEIEIASGSVSIEHAQSTTDQIVVSLGEGETTDKTSQLDSPVELVSEVVQAATPNIDGNAKPVAEEISADALVLSGDSVAIESPSMTDIKAEPASAARYVSEEGGFNHNLENLSYDETVWKVQEDGLYSNAVGKADQFLFSESQASNFIYETDVTFLKNEGAASLFFRGNNETDNLNGYVVNLDGYSKKAKFWRWAEANLIEEKDVAATDDNRYHLKVIAADEWISYYINDVLIANLSDYTVQKDDRGQTTPIEEGYFGLLNWNGEILFQNTNFTVLDDKHLPFIKDVLVSSKTGAVEEKGQFFPKEALHIQYVKHDAETIDLTFIAEQAGTKITVTDSQGNHYDDFSNIPLAVGSNYLTVTSELAGPNGQTVAIVYRLNIHRRQKDAVYYNELYRGQFHYSVKDGWANDPNGLVYYNGTYHLFYQFYDDTQWGPMHWAHATSKDLVTWEEHPIAFYPDATGTMFSGCIVVDAKNTSGLFAEGQGGLVALITINGEGQRVKLAYSTDEGKTWIKSDKIAADWSNDPLNNRDFRDPKVFRWEDKWFMVIAGGPLRIYSSDNLQDWTVETAYGDLHMECPDLYPIQAPDGNLKWVLSRGGRGYKVGDFKQIDGKWNFVPDVDYQDSDGIMNFGKDSYAAMTYYVQDFGNATNPTLPDLVAINWMNTWDDYCRIVADTVGQAFNGTFNLNLKLGLVKEGDKYVLTQKPVENYNSLRELDKAITYTDVDVTAENDLFKNVASDTYEIISTFRPSADTTKIGFNLRVGDGEVTKVIYDLTTETLSIDRSQSGIILTDIFARVDSQKVTRHADGSIDLHLYVDRSSVEVFAKGHTVAGANQIFPAPTSLGVQVFAEGGVAKADIAFYPLKTIWTDKIDVTTTLDLIQASPKDQRVYVGKTADLKAYIMPVKAVQDVSWSVEDGSILAITENGTSATITALKKGTTIVRATSKENPALVKEYTITVLEDNFKTNLTNLKTFAGNWYVDGESLLVSNHHANDAYMTTEALLFDEYQLDLDFKYERGAINIFFAAPGVDPAHSYAIQFSDRDVIRLYRFHGDTFQEAPLTAAINDGEFHHLTLMKTKDAIKVYLDEAEVLTHSFDSLDDFFNQPYIGLGLWDGALEVQNFFVKDLNAKSEVSKPEEDKDKKESPKDGQALPAKDEKSTKPSKDVDQSKQEAGKLVTESVKAARTATSVASLPKTNAKGQSLILLLVGLLGLVASLFTFVYKKEDE